VTAEVIQLMVNRKQDIKPKEKNEFFLKISILSVFIFWNYYFIVDVHPRG
jgi:hypothetical protein